MRSMAEEKTDILMDWVELHLSFTCTLQPNLCNPFLIIIFRVGLLLQRSRYEQNRCLRFLVWIILMIYLTTYFVISGSLAGEFPIYLCNNR